MPRELKCLTMLAIFLSQHGRLSHSCFSLQLRLNYQHDPAAPSLPCSDGSRSLEFCNLLCLLHCLRSRQSGNSREQTMFKDKNVKVSSTIITDTRRILEISEKYCDIINRKLHVFRRLQAEGACHFSALWISAMLSHTRRIKITYKALEKINLDQCPKLPMTVL